MKLPLGLALLPLLASVSTVALAAGPVPLTNGQMDKVTAGFFATATAAAMATGATYAAHTTLAAALVTQTTMTGTSAGGETTLTSIMSTADSASTAISH